MHSFSLSCTGNCQLEIKIEKILHSQQHNYKMLRLVRKRTYVKWVINPYEEHKIWINGKIYYVLGQKDLLSSRCKCFKIYM